MGKNNLKNKNEFKIDRVIVSDWSALVRHDSMQNILMRVLVCIYQYMYSHRCSCVGGVSAAFLPLLRKHRDHI